MPVRGMRNRAGVLGDIAGPPAFTPLSVSGVGGSSGDLHTKYTPMRNNRHGSPRPGDAPQSPDRIPPNRGGRARIALRRSFPALLAAVAATIAGCTTPLSDSSERALQRAVVESVRRELDDARTRPDPMVTARQGAMEDLRIEDRFLEEIARTSGPDSYDPTNPDVAPLGRDLLGRDPRTVRVSLERAMRAAVANNLEVQFASLGPAVAQTQVVQAEAAFDWVLFANLERSWLNDQNLTTGTILSRNARDVVASRAGLRRTLPGGSAFTIQQDITYTQVRQSGTISAKSQNTALNWSFQYDQPLMRNFGADVALAQVRLARNAERNQIALLERQLLQLTLEVERTYWSLWLSHHDLMILQRLVERGRAVSAQVEARGHAVNPANIANARARVIEREANVLRAQNVLRRTSDRLKLLMNDPAIPAGSEILLLPADRPLDEPMAYSLADALFTAIERRPEIAQSILSLDDTSIRMLVASNQRRPQLDLRFQARLNALEEQTEDAYREVLGGSFASWVTGLFFEQPLGNRDAEAAFTRRRLERSQAAISYQNTVQAVTVEVKSALDNMSTNYQLIVKTRLARVAAAEVLRSLIVQRTTIQEISAERLDLELGRQEALASAEREELRALVDYNVAIAEWFAAQGTALDRNRIKFVVPSVSESMHWPYLPAESATAAQQWWARRTAGQASADPAQDPPAEPSHDDPSADPAAEPVVPPTDEPVPGPAPTAQPEPDPTMFPIQGAGGR